jgi:hypothetical protein
MLYNYVIISIRPGYPGKNRDDVSLWEVRAKACQKSGPVRRTPTEVYGGNARLAGSGCNRTSVKNGQGGLKLFFGLIFLVTFCIKTKSNSLRGSSGTD